MGRKVKKTKLKPLFRLHKQRHDADCAVASVAMALNLSYEAVLVVASRIAPKVLTRGLFSVEMILIAADFGRVLMKKLKVDTDTDTGVLVVRVSWGEHAVFLTNGLVFETNGDIWDAEQYVKANSAKVLHLLEEK